jgi:hypothetical protein
VQKVSPPPHDSACADEDSLPILSVDTKYSPTRLKGFAIALAIVLFSMLTANARAQTPLPVPNIVDHQVVTEQNAGLLQATENIQTAYNWVVLYVTCNYGSTKLDPRSVTCLAGGSVADQNGNHFALIKHVGNVAENWGMDSWYIIPATTGSMTVNAPTEFFCSSGCTFNMVVEQVQGIEGHD